MRPRPLLAWPCTPSHTSLPTAGMPPSARPLQHLRRARDPGQAAATGQSCSSEPSGPRGAGPHGGCLPLLGQESDPSKALSQTFLVNACHPWCAPYARHRLPSEVPQSVSSCSRHMWVSSRRLALGSDSPDLESQLWHFPLVSIGECLPLSGPQFPDLYSGNSNTVTSYRHTIVLTNFP